MKKIDYGFIKNLKVNRLKSHCFHMVVLFVLMSIFFCAAFVIKEIYKNNAFIVIFYVLFVLFLLYTAVDEIIKTKKKLKNAENSVVEYKIVETYLLGKEARESSDEYGDSTKMIFWCGEQYGKIGCFCEGKASFRDRKLGQPFYVCLRYSYEKGSYVGEMCLSKNRYELSENVRSSCISYEEYAEKAKKR